MELTKIHSSDEWEAGVGLGHNGTFPPRPMLDSLWNSKICIGFPVGY